MTIPAALMRTDVVVTLCFVAACIVMLVGFSVARWRNARKLKRRGWLP